MIASHFDLLSTHYIVSHPVATIFFFTPQDFFVQNWERWVYNTRHNSAEKAANSVMKNRFGITIDYCMCQAYFNQDEGIWEVLADTMLCFQYKANKTETLDLCQRKRSLAMRQGGILFWILEFISYFIMMRQVFSNVFVLFGNCEKDEAGINYNFWLYPQHQVAMREVWY